MENGRKRPGYARLAEPLYASEELVADAVLGPGHLREWRERAPILERDGLPLIDELMGGRYLPAVRKFFDLRNGVLTGQAVPQRADAKENFPCRKPPKTKLQNQTRPALNGEPEKVANVFHIGPPNAKP
jgi:hypothetical protein